MTLLQDCPEILLPETPVRTLETPDSESFSIQEPLPEGDLQRWLDLCG